MLLTPLLRLLGATETILPFARQYAWPLLVAAPLQTAGFVLNNTLRSEGNAVRAMAGVVLGSLLNVALNPLFMFAFGWGMVGAAAATVCGQTLSCLFLFWQYQRKKQHARLSFRCAGLGPGPALAMAKVGFPTFLRQGSTMLATILLNRACMPFGDGAIAVVSIVSRILWFLVSVLIGFGQGLQPAAGYSFGAGDVKRTLKAYRWALGYALGFSIAAAALCFFFAPQLYSGFFHQRALSAIWVFMYALAAAVIAHAGVCHRIQYADAVHRPGVVCSLLAVSRQGLFFVPLIFLLPGLYGACVAFCWPPPPQTR